jgi:TPR repeat protein
LEDFRDALQNAMADAPDTAQRVIDLLSRFFDNAQWHWSSRRGGIAMLTRLRSDHPQAFAALQAMEKDAAGAAGARSVAADGDIGVAVTGDGNTVVTGGELTRVAGDHLDFRDATFHDQVIGVQHVSNTYETTTGVPRPVPGDWPLARDVDPLAQGVRPARKEEGRSLLPPYAGRDVDGAVRAALETGRAKGTFVVVRGDAYTGKTRTALQALAEALPDARVFAPGRGEDLRMLPGVLRGWTETCVLWLDDLDRHIDADRAGGLEPRLLAQLTGQGAVVLATLREEAYDDVRQTADGRVLDLAHIVELPREWSDPERRRAKGLGDVRLAEAVRHGGAVGVAAYLTVGPLLWEEWQRARRPDRHPRGYALVRAAIDLARCGLRGPLPQDLLVTVHEAYEGVAGLERESVEEALEWAAGKRHGVLRMLRRSGARGWEAAPCLVDTALREEGFPEVDGAVWGCALEAARTDSMYDFETVARTAREAFRRAAEAGDSRAMFNLGVLTESLGEEAEAERWLRRAAGAGQPEAAGRLGRMLVGRGEPKEAGPFLETAAEAGDAKAATLLAKVLLGEARRWLKQAADARDAEAAHQLGDLLFMAGDTDGASDLYTTAEGQGHAAVARNEGVLALLRGEQETAKVFLERAADGGDRRAAAFLKTMRGRAQTLAEAEESFEDVMEAALYPWDHAHLGVVLEKQGAPV